MTTPQTLKARSDKGSVQIKVSHERLQIVFRFGGKRHYLSTGFSDTATNRKLAEIKARQIELDIISGNFDPSLDKYRIAPLASKPDPITAKNSFDQSLDDLWERYAEFKRPSLSLNTLSKEYSTAGRCIDKLLPTRSLDEAIKIRDWIVANRSPDAAKRLLTLITSCCDWSKKSGLIPENPFEGMSQELKVPKSSTKSEEEAIDPFSPEERDLVIQTFAEHKHYKYYTAFIAFLFKTGCRPSEAVALQWKHISHDFTTISFEDAVINCHGRLLRRKGLKTQQSRKFPANPTLQTLLREHQPPEYQPEDLVFPSPDNKFIDFHNFRNRGWITILQILPQIHYRKPYQTRHTFITLALENGLDAKDVARLVGNSPEMICKHYAGRKRELIVPEF
jgi:integrase